MSAPFSYSTSISLPSDYDLGSAAGVEFLTSCVRTGSGGERRRVKRSYPVAALAVAWTERPSSNFSSQLSDFFAYKGRSSGFMATHPLGFSVTSETPLPLGSNQYQIVKRHWHGAVNLMRKVLHPSSITVKQGKSTISSGSYSVSGGVITYAGYKALDIMWVIDQTNAVQMPYVSGTGLSNSKTWIQSANTAINSLSTSNRMGVVTYNSTATNSQALTSTLATVNSAVSSVASSSNTPDISNALSTAATALAAQTSGGNVPCLILVTGGKSSSGTEVSTLQSIMAAHPTWVVCVIEVNHASGSYKATYSTNHALVTSLGAVDSGVFTGNTSDSFSKAVQRILGILFGVTCTYSIPVRLDNKDSFDFERKTFKFGRKTLPLIEIAETGGWSIANSAPSNAFDYICLPVSVVNPSGTAPYSSISPGTSGGPEYFTIVSEFDSGFAGAVQEWARSYSSWKVGWDTLALADVETLRDFFMSRQGRARGFLFDDPFDDTATTQTIGTGTGSQTAFTLANTYGSNTVNTPLPIPGTIALTVAGVAKTEWTDYTVDYTTGIVTFTSAPANGAAIVASWQFYKVGRFGTDKFMPTVRGYVQNTSVPSIASWSNVDVVEIPAS